MKLINRSIWYNEKKGVVEVIDQRKLPFKLEIIALDSLKKTAFAIKEMVVRGAPLIGVTAAYGMAIAAKVNMDLQKAYNQLHSTRPTAINLKWALDRQLNLANRANGNETFELLLKEAHKIAEEDIEMSSSIGEHGIKIIQEIYNRKKGTVNILTHCNAGWLATVQWGTATAPMYKAHLKEIPIHVWVDETRPRNQGARLTAWELGRAEIPFHVITDNAGGHLMQHGEVDIVITGSDRTTSQGDVCNKIGTYLKALAAYDNHIPFYVALPSSTIDWTIKNGLSEIPIEERKGNELTHMTALRNGQIEKASIMSIGTPVKNYAFDVTPAKYITGLITERGICPASSDGLNQLFNK